MSRPIPVPHAAGPSAHGPASVPPVPPAPAAHEGRGGPEAQEAPQAPWPGPLRGLLGLGGAYFAVAMLSLFVGRQPGTVAVVWFANAVAVAALALQPRRRWSGLLLAVAVANALSNRVWGDAWGAAAAFAVPNVVEVLLAAVLLHRLGGRAAASLPGGLAASWRGPLPLLRLWLLAGLLPQLVGATLGAALLAATGVAPFASSWLRWLMGSALGAVAVLPLATLVLRLPRAELRRQLLSLRVGALLCGACGTTVLCLAHVPYPFVYVAVAVSVGAMLAELAGAALIALGVALTMALSIALGVFVLPPVSADWEIAFVYLACGAALAPPQLLAASLAELREANARLSERGEALRRSNATLEQFVHIASHDLREPLNTVVQFSDLLQQDHGEQMGPQGRRYLGLVHAAASRMRGLLDDVLRYTRLQSERLPPLQPVPLDAVMDEVRQALAGRLLLRDSQLHVEPLPTVLGHRAWLSLLLQNLVGNALKFVPPDRQPVVRVSARCADGQAWLQVRDNGVGIAPQDLPRLFKPFVRLQRRRDFDGTGLGLVLCQQVAEQHGSRIEVQSVPGAGSCFSLRLPLAPAPAAGRGPG